jgi:hypothetical protein
MELERPALNTAARRPDERALFRVALRDGAFDRGRDVPTPLRCERRPPWSCRRRELRPLQFLDEHRQRAIEDLRGITVRY